MKQLPSEFVTTPLAHRTLHDVKDGRPENSIEGARAAIAQGFGIEIDIQLTADDQALVFHDYALMRLTGATGHVRDKSKADMDAIPLIGSPSAAPSLTDFLDVIDGQVPLLIELKDQDGALGDANSALEAAVCDSLKGYKGQVALMSFNPHMVARCAKLAPNIPRGIVTDPYSKADWPKVPEERRKTLATIDRFDEVGASFISHNVNDLQSAYVKRIKDKGAPILCWTVKSAASEAAARRIADNITFEQYIPDQKGI